MSSLTTSQTILHLRSIFCTTWLSWWVSNRQWASVFLPRVFSFYQCHQHGTHYQWSVIPTVQRLCRAFSQDCEEFTVLFTRSVWSSPCLPYNTTWKWVQPGTAPLQLTIANQRANYPWTTSSLSSRLLQTCLSRWIPETTLKKEFQLSSQSSTVRSSTNKQYSLHSRLQGNWASDCSACTSLIRCINTYWQL